MKIANLETDPAKDFGIAYARKAYNDSLPKTVNGPLDEEGNPTQVPNPDLSPSDVHYLMLRLGNVIDSWAAQATAANAAPAPAPAPGVVNGVPQSVTRKQGRAALILAGMFDAVQPAIDAIPNNTQRALAQNAWDTANTFDRTDPFTLMLATTIGLSNAQIDELFIAAAQL